jgi:hypothetical protein
MAARSVNEGNATRIPGNKRPCIMANGKPKVKYASLDDAVAAAAKHTDKPRHAYRCPICQGWHVGSVARRMIFPRADDLCDPGLRTYRCAHAGQVRSSRRLNILSEATQGRYSHSLFVCTGPFEPLHHSIGNLLISLAFGIQQEIHSTAIFRFRWRFDLRFTKPIALQV